MYRCQRSRLAISLVEIMIAMAVLSTLALPMGMFLVEQTRGSSQLGDYYQILNLLEEKLDIALEMPYHDLPAGESSNLLLNASGHSSLDLRPTEVANNLVYFSLRTEVLPINMSARKDAASIELQTILVEESIKRLEIFAIWGDKQQHRLNLVAYRANL